MEKKFEIVASRWPWQKGYSWKGMTDRGAPLNRGKDGCSPRFGGGWKYKFGLSYASSETGWSLMLDLIFGMVIVRRRIK